jgi:hypothetical protein
MKASTVLGWHRKGFRLFWTWKIRRGKLGRPSVPKEVRELVRSMSRENPLWGAPRIHGELLKLGIDIGETSVSKYMVRSRRPPSQTWRTFLENHVQSMVTVDFFAVPTRREAQRSVATARFPTSAPVMILTPIQVRSRSCDVLVRSPNQPENCAQVRPVYWTGVLPLPGRLSTFGLRRRRLASERRPRAVAPRVGRVD